MKKRVAVFYQCCPVQLYYATATETSTLHRNYLLAPYLSGLCFSSEYERYMSGMHIHRLEYCFKNILLTPLADNLTCP